MPAMLTRRTFLAFSALASAATVLPALAQAQASDPVAFAKALYQLDGMWSDVIAAPKKYLTDEFSAVVDENSQYSSDLEYAVDYDPLVQAQDWDELKDLKFTSESNAGGKAVIRVEFSNTDDAVTVRLDLVQTGDGWHIADVRDAKGFSLLQEYRDLNSEAKAASAKN
jgi:ABC-type transporter MlaC component